MTNILVNPTQDHIMALLSKLAYVDLSVNYDFSLLTNNTQFCEAEISYLCTNYRVVSSSMDDISYVSGFQGFIVQNKNTLNYTYVIRGTEKNKLEDYDDDLDIVNSGMAYKQFIDAYNYYIKTTTPTGITAQILKIVKNKKMGVKNYVATNLPHFASVSTNKKNRPSGRSFFIGANRETRSCFVSSAFALLGNR